jgi:hypothetical protein
MSRLVRIFAFVAFASVPVLGQSNPPVAVPLSQGVDLKEVQDFRPLFEKRETIVEDIRQLEREIDEREAEIRGLPSESELRKQLRDTRVNLENAKKNTADPTNYVGYLDGQIEVFEGNLKTIEQNRPLIKTKRDEAERKKRELFALEQRIASLFDNARDVNRFRIYVAVAFSALVFAVILGFYWIANKQNIATTIFSGEMGMQFVTLFLIVIAIILFGIIGTLEGRELAALLGGLSGYILGRASDARRNLVPREQNSAGDGTEVTGDTPDRY